MRNIPVSSRLNSAKERSPFLRAYASCNPQILLCFRLGENMHMRANATEIIELKMSWYLLNTMVQNTQKIAGILYVVRNTISYILCALVSLSSDQSITVES